MTIDVIPDGAARAPCVDEANFRATFLRVLRRAWLAAAAGGVAGFVVGGIGGRLAMLVLRLTSDERVVGGVESDDGFTIGRFSFATVFLLLLTTALGAAAGLAYAAVRPAFPTGIRRACWATFCGAIGGSALVHKDGVDFRFLEPVMLAIALFVIIPVGGAWTMAWLMDRWERWWIADRRRTAVASLFALPGAIAGIGMLIAAVLVVGAAVAFTSQRASLQRVTQHVALRAAVCIGLTMLAMIGVRDLAGDIAELT
jgi:hypothetical protein